MAKRIPHITEAELRIMKLLWQHGPSTVRQVLESLPMSDEDRPAYTTVMTLMKQLADKGALVVDRERQPFVYKPAVRRDQVFRHRVSEFLHEVFDGQAVDLVLRLVEDEQLSVEDLRQIEAKVRQREQVERNRPAD
jgi:predicted transcriptional regulator